MRRSIRLAELCQQFGLDRAGEDIVLDGINLCNRESQHKHILSYATDDSYVDVACNNKAVMALIINDKDFPAYEAACRERGIELILTREPEKLFYDIHEYLYCETDFYERYEFETKIGDGCRIHESAIVESGVILGNDVTVGANSVIRHGSVIGDGSVIGCNSTIGSEGFQILRIAQENRKVPHCGGVWMGAHVCVGDNVTVCNALFEGNTYIGTNTMIDNLVHVGHNGYVGENAVITAGVILCGSAVVEDGAWIGVNSSVLNGVIVGEYSKLGIGSVVTRDVPEYTLAYGVPARAKNALGGGKTWRCVVLWNLNLPDYKKGKHVQKEIRSPVEWNLRMIRNR